MKRPLKFDPETTLPVGDGRHRFVPTNGRLHFGNPIAVTGAHAKGIIRRLMDTGEMISATGGTLWVATEWCQVNNVQHEVTITYSGPHRLGYRLKLSI